MMVVALDSEPAAEPEIDTVVEVAGGSGQNLDASDTTISTGVVDDEINPTPVSPDQTTGESVSENSMSDAPADDIKQEDIGVDSSDSTDGGGAFQLTLLLRLFFASRRARRDNRNSY